MKKQISKLHLGKRAISNLSESIIKSQMGGGETKKGCETYRGCSGYCTENCSYFGCTFDCTVATCKGQTCRQGASCNC